MPILIQMNNTGSLERNSGMMEYWNVGSLKSKTLSPPDAIGFLYTHFSIIPAFQHSMT